MIMLWCHNTRVGKCLVASLNEFCKAHVKDSVSLINMFAELIYPMSSFDPHPRKAFFKARFGAGAKCRRGLIFERGSYLI